jgi:hypothetical protein
MEHAAGPAAPPNLLNRMNMFLLRIVVLMGVLPGLLVAADERDTLPKPEKRTERKMEGWLVKVDDRLLKPDSEVGARALQLLEAQLANIRSVVPPNSLEKLQKVVIVLDLDHGRLKAAQYHPSAGWLEGHGYSRDLEKCVHIPHAASFINPRTNNEQPWCVLHELAHAYNDQVLGFDNPEIRKAYDRYKASGHGDSVLFVGGGKKKHYALTNQKEFFAEMTEAYFGMNDFFPFNRGELKTEEPDVFELLRKVWGPSPVER